MVEVRRAMSDDAASIRKIHLSAFETCLEADLVERLEQNGEAVISMVATADGAIVGHILFSRMECEADGQPMDALGLAPVAVLPERQSRGIGTRLIEAGLDEARSLAVDIVFLVGEPDYYGRFGFSAATAAPFASPYAGEYFQAKPISVGFTPPGSGRAEYPTAFAGVE